MGLEGGECCREFCSRLLVLCPRPRNSSRNFGEACSGGRQLPPIFWQRISRGGRELFGRGLAEGGGSYRQFWERRALREGSHRRFFGREFAEGRGQLPPIFGEACPGGRQPSPIFWQRICRGETTAIANFWSGVPWGKAAIADFLAKKLLILPLAKAG